MIEGSDIFKKSNRLSPNQLYFACIGFMERKLTDTYELLQKVSANKGDITYEYGRIYLDKVKNQYLVVERPSPDSEEFFSIKKVHPKMQEALHEWCEKKNLKAVTFGVYAESKSVYKHYVSWHIKDDKLAIEDSKSWLNPFKYWIKKHAKNNLKVDDITVKYHGWQKDMWSCGYYAYCAFKKLVTGEEVYKPKIDSGLFNEMEANFGIICPKISNNKAIKNKITTIEDDFQVVDGDPEDELKAVKQKDLKHSGKKLHAINNGSSVPSNTSLDSADKPLAKINKEELIEEKTEKKNENFLKRKQEFIKILTNAKERSNNTCSKKNRTLWDLLGVNDKKSSEKKFASISSLLENVRKTIHTEKELMNIVNKVLIKGSKISKDNKLFKDIKNIRKARGFFKPRVTRDIEEFGKNNYKVK